MTAKHLFHTKVSRNTRKYNTRPLKTCVTWKHSSPYDTVEHFPGRNLYIGMVTRKIRKDSNHYSNWYCSNLRTP